MSKIRIGIVDDHQAVAKGLSAELSAGSGVEVLFVASDKTEALTCLSQQVPDVLIMDVVMPGSVSVDAFREVLKVFPQLRILAYTALNSPAMIELLLRTGVKGYVSKAQALAEVQEAVTQVAEGNLYLPEEYSFIRKKIQVVPEPAELSKREIEILQLIAQEKTTQEISAELFISVSTVETHRKNLFQKLNVTNLAGLIKAGINLGYLH